MGGGPGHAHVLSTAGRLDPVEKLFCLIGMPSARPARRVCWQKLEEELPMSAMWTTLTNLWYYLDEIDCVLIWVLTIVMIYILYKLRQLESANAHNQGSVNVAVSSPAVLPMQTMQPAPPVQPAARVADPYDIVFNRR